MGIETGHHVRYIRHRKDPHEERRGTITLFGIHPLVWANRPPDAFREFFWNEIISWQEFQDPDGVIRKAFDEGNVLSCGISEELEGGGDG